MIIKKFKFLYKTVINKNDWTTILNFLIQNKIVDNREVHVLLHLVNTILEIKHRNNPIILSNVFQALQKLLHVQDCLWSKSITSVTRPPKSVRYFLDHIRSQLYMVLEIIQVFLVVIQDELIEQNLWPFGLLLINFTNNETLMQQKKKSCQNQTKFRINLFQNIHTSQKLLCFIRNLEAAAFVRFITTNLVFADRKWICNAIRRAFLIQDSDCLTQSSFMKLWAASLKYCRMLCRSVSISGVLSIVLFSRSFSCW